MTIPIAFVLNEYYLPYCSAAILSILENSNKDNTYHFFLLTKNISDNAVYPLKVMLAGFQHAALSLIDVTRYVSNYTFKYAEWSEEVYYKLLIPYIFLEFDKVICLDGDVICVSDITRLYNIDINDYLIAGVRDLPVIGKFLRLETQHETMTMISELSNYINGGVLVFNTKKFRKSISIDGLLDLAVSRIWKMNEQDLLNYYCDKKTLVLSNVFDFMNCDISNIYNYLPDNLKIEYTTSSRSPCIIHYVSKPWKLPYITSFSELFWKYATRTPYIEVIMERMRQEGLIIKNAVDLHDYILSNIKNRGGLGLRFIIKCIVAWINRDKKR
jgi:lipopolysaccharide biosynthesis glycosyltransferase